MRRKVTMTLVGEQGKAFVVAHHPVHGEKWLTQVTRTQVLSRGQAFRTKAERVFMARNGREVQVQFTWFDVDVQEDKARAFLRIMVDTLGLEGLRYACQQIELFGQGIRDSRICDGALVALS